MSANKSAQNLDAILDKRHMTYVEFATRMKEHGHHITPKQVVRSIGRYRDYASMRKHVTPDMINAAAHVLGVPVSEITG